MGSYLTTPIKTKETIEGNHKNLRYVCSSMQGWRTSMEDAHICEVGFDDKKELSLFGIFDGHGGKEASLFVSEIFLNELKQNENFQKQNYALALKENCLRMDEIMKTREGLLRLYEIRNGLDKGEGKNCFHLEDRDLNYENLSAGCTANIILLTKNYIYCANVGDSRTVLCKENGLPYQLSNDHKPKQEQEQNRILAAGGCITDGRINGTLNLSRALGDLQMKCNKELPPEEQMVTSLPDIWKKEIKKDDDFLLMGCDGIWECMTNLQLVTYIKDKIKNKNKTPLKPIVEDLLDILISPNTSDYIYGLDNMSIILILLKH